MPSVFDASENDPIVLLVIKTVFGICLALGAPFVAYSLVQTIRTASRSQTWPETTATITRSEVKTDFAVGANGPQSEPVVEYRYEVDGKSYDGREIALRSLKSRSSSAAEQVANQYPVGTRHPVYYDPQSPARSLLERGTGWLTYVGLGIPLVMLLVGPMVAWEQIRVIRARYS